MDELELEILEIDTQEVENELFENFADKYLVDAVRIVSTKFISQDDVELIHEGMCVLIAIYMNKVRNGEINKNKVLH